MPLWLQHLLVLSLVGGCVVWVVWQGVQSLRGRRSRIGSCCAKGCSPTPDPAGAPSAAATAKAEKVVFLPVEALVARSRRKPR